MSRCGAAKIMISLIDVNFLIDIGDPDLVIVLEMETDGNMLDRQGKWTIGLERLSQNKGEKELIVFLLS